MKNFNKLLDIFKNNEGSMTKNKKSTNIRFNSTLFFQVGLIVSITLVALIINASYGELEKSSALPFPNTFEEPFYLNDFVIVKPIIPEIPAEKKLVTRKLITDKVLVIDKPIANKPEEPIYTTPVELPVNTPVVKDPSPIEEEPTSYSMIGVERVPVFPGCESLDNNKERIACLSKEIGIIINRKFDKNLASELGLEGEQRIYISFTINKLGKVADVKVRAPHPRLEKEAFKVLQYVPKMIPGMQSNKNVDVLFSLPIIFNIQ
ncbi:MAG: hypothetical protein COZ75_09875 [Flavobacteriaceae bacterium CG_4_8_14_3_um_filter_34_10]|nr:MAG: hypothetical protein AUK33_09740 [Flavobacteriaceae bacterium CG2_30_34_30]PIQ19270.1 MAG: hypothetical protein COW66_01855 [Flavobacteriaceae bacterium CG18_big_fil_WC_8_21_14_2_50_34_36]PIV48534.1 MAG: hypothetical protein COS19_13345 [Flavobacteriaceae bacterium CG02_land_8_20_14_3_00_34_13]PIX08839.1 MAG: hypothetical protein COZ75_09875 [Flavobacteriaceae bacterium CG_4_8_14_3_um_filter_34_10]PIZ07284.1 MAG: hypothetical protein COY56_09800 [Flavobacteriaceae bacterium CG_4_10_14_0